MLGTLLNSFKNLGDTITEATKLIDFGPSFFGLNSTMIFPDLDATPPVTYPEGRTSFLGSELAALSNNQTLSYKELTIPEGITISADSYYKTGHLAPGAYAPLIIRCKDTLKINGTVTATGAGETANIGTNLIDYGEMSNIQKVSSPNKSVQSITYTQLSNYFINHPFGNLYSFYFGTGGGNGSVVYSISSGGLKNGIAGGGSGGCIVIYYNHLYGEMANGSIKEYGVDVDFPIERIHANGVGGNCGSNITRGGGMLILSAKNIYIGVNGQISADGTLPEGITQTGTNFSFLNNLPQLGDGQSGIYWDSTTNSYVSGTPGTREYYFSSGKDFTKCNAYVDETLCGSAELCGGAGCVFGYRVNS